MTAAKQMKAGKAVKTGKISALALALALGLMTTAEAEDWTGGYTTFGLSRSSVDLQELAGGVPRANGGVNVAPYVAFGYDWAVGNFTIGVVADFDLTGTDNADLLSAGKGTYAESDWFATLRGRVGMAATDKLHIYASGGVAAMQVTATTVDFIGGQTSGGSQSVAGKVAGLGLEYNLSPGRNLSVEFLHGAFDTSPNLSTDSFTSSTVEPDLNAFRVGYTMRF
jgi:opacity protein-like surface antigen